MSAINQQPSLIDRAGELRTDPAALAELLKRAKVLSVGGGKVSADLASAKLLYPNAQSDENYFLGIDRATDTPYFAAMLPTQKIYFHCAKSGQLYHHLKLVWLCTR